VTLVLLPLKYGIDDCITATVLLLGDVGGATQNNNWPVCSLILRKISKIGATKCQIVQ